MTPLEQARQYARLVDEATVTDIESLSDSKQTLDELWKEYGVRLGASATGEPPESVAKKSFSKRLSDLRRIFCESKDVKAILDDPAVAAEMNLAAVLAGVLISQRYGGFNYAIIALLVLRIGLSKLCSGKIEDSDDTEAKTDS